MTATAAGSDAGSDYEHWQDDEEYLSQSVVAVNGYDNHNGLRSHTYYPPVPSPKAQPAQVIYCQQPTQMVAYPPMQYTYAPMAYPGQAYYAYPIQQAPVQQQPMPGYQVYQPAYSAPAPQEQKVKSIPWGGRTKKQVDDDNQIIAKVQGVNDKRKVAPVDVKDDQMMWCVETDGSHTLR